MAQTYQTLDFTDTFLQTVASRDFSAAERRQFLKALALLDVDERHPSLRLHPLQGDRDGSWAARASDAPSRLAPGPRQSLGPFSVHR